MIFYFVLMQFQANREAHVSLHLLVIGRDHAVRLK